MRRGYVVIIFLLLSSLACGLFATPTPVTIPTNLPPPPSSTPVPLATTTAAAEATQTATAAGTSSPTEEPTSTPYPTSVLDSQLSTEINLIQSQVVEERGLQPKYHVPVVLLSPDELRHNIVNDFLADYTDEKTSDDVLELSTVGLIDPNFDFRTFYTDLLSEEIAGYYDNDVKEMFVVQGEAFQGEERSVYAHEYTHALQDQYYDIKNGLKYNDDTCEADSEYCAAVQALMEGDASLSQYIWETNYATAQDKQQIDAFRNSLKLPVYDSAPAFLKDDFVFPYNQGATFVVDIFNKGGFSAIDAVYKNPPVSTEQILHPELYPSDKPIPVNMPELASVLGSGWREVTHNQMGEWYTYLILARGANSAARLDDTSAQAAAAGWGGDEYLLLHNDATNATVFVMKTVWDTTNDASEFATAFEKYANIRFGVSASQQGDTLTWTFSGGYSSLYHSGGTTIWIITPDAATAQTVASQVQP